MSNKSNSIKFDFYEYFIYIRIFLFATLIGFSIFLEPFFVFQDKEISFAFSVLVAVCIELVSRSFEDRYHRKQSVEQLKNIADQYADLRKIQNQNLAIVSITGLNEILRHIGPRIARAERVFNTNMGLADFYYDADADRDQIIGLYRKWLRSENPVRWTDITSRRGLYSGRYEAIKLLPEDSEKIHVYVVQKALPVCNFIIIESASGSRSLYFGWSAFDSEADETVFYTENEQVIQTFRNQFKRLQEKRYVWDTRGYPLTYGGESKDFFPTNRIISKIGWWWNVAYHPETSIPHHVAIVEIDFPHGAASVTVQRFQLAVGDGNELKNWTYRKFDHEDELGMTGDTLVLEQDDGDGLFLYKFKPVKSGHKNEIYMHGYISNAVAYIDDREVKVGRLDILGQRMEEALADWDYVIDEDRTRAFIETSIEKFKELRRRGLP